MIFEIIFFLFFAFIFSLLIYKFTDLIEIKKSYFNYKNALKKLFKNKSYLHGKNSSDLKSDLDNISSTGIKLIFIILKFLVFYLLFQILIKKFLNTIESSLFFILMPSIPYLSLVFKYNE